jgi:hypothetical protein
VPFCCIFLKYHNKFGGIRAKKLAWILRIILIAGGDENRQSPPTFYGIDWMQEMRSGLVILHEGCFYRLCYAA